MANYHEEDIRAYLKDAFGFEGSLDDSTERLVQLFEEIGVDMYFDGALSEERIENIDVKSVLTVEERQQIIRDCLRG